MRRSKRGGQIMGFFEAVNSVFAGSFKFSGRAPRSEFWWFFLFEVLAAGTLLAIDARHVMGTINAAGGNPEAVFGISVFDYMLTYYFLATFFPRMAVTIRRLHDVGLSGYLYLLYFVPGLGGIAVLILTAMPSENGDNSHGPRHRRSGKRRAAGAGPRPHDPMQAYAVLDRINAKPTPEMLAARKAEVRALYEQRVLGKSPMVAE